MVTQESTYDRVMKLKLVDADKDKPHDKCKTCPRFALIPLVCADAACIRIKTSVEQPNHADQTPKPDPAS